ncbi:transcriptional regulator [Cronobacter turicensis]|uniref:HTH-type transcriptional regulator yjdC n=1 Tax=Cronobacter turicensis (strain DSM 18703 / CCUG 55852 / LMG 23827 / z3032) TaxID=693216 RepID=C9Y1B0_CROTZ|nr:transcriptional regulator [Cronobacter turicensis]MEB8538351.1 transcriptional regulator [Cronobacter sakazakii]CBA34038.1 HTH-type transcriptional regulator yjdC [Cronobacter turicensis z3032]CCJ89868.1 Transcriptional regulator, TetR family [Cronobacter turicensis 564]EGT4493682.1 transcriptional regulator [Cronobacter turicensis]EGT5682776.1 transcriptional regulator [Cronobacter turicensis]
MQREEVLEQALHVLEQEGIANTTPEMVAAAVQCPTEEIHRYWPDREALLYDALRYLSQRVDAWRRQLIYNEELSAEQKLMARYQALTDCVSQDRYPGCLFIAACTFYPEASHPIHQLADQQKRAAYHYTHELLTQLEVDDPAMVAEQMELVLEGCLSRLLVKRSQADVDTARRLAEDILRFAQCRQGGALT